MKKNSLKSIAWSLACVGILTACGGGTDDEAGAPIPLQVAPPEVKISTTDTECGPIFDTDTGAMISQAEVFINGGTAPFRVETTFPDSVRVSKNFVAHRGESFSVYLYGGCVDPAVIIVTDSLNNLVSFKITYKAATTATPT